MMDSNNFRTDGQDASERLTTKKKPPIWLFIVIGLAIIAVVAVIVIIVVVGNSGSKAQKKITAAEKYLSELDYEKAIASYNAAIEIDPTSLEAYLGLADVYTAMADDLVGKAAKYEAKGDSDKAQEAYEEAIGYYNEALEVLDEALDNVSEEDIKKVEKKKDKIEGYIDEAEDARDDGSETDDLDEKDSVDGGDDSGVGDTEAGTETDDFTNSYVGGYVTFGTYEQDGNEANGPEPIEWEVLDINENGMLLVSKYVLDVQPYNVEQTGVTWETCTLRSWLNSDFLNAAFDSNEQSRINTTYVVNADNSYYGTEGGNDTYDKIFCLSVDEILRYYRFNKYYDEYQYGYCQRLMTEPTQYAINRGVYTRTMSQEDCASHGYSTDAVGKVGAWWWLRSPGGFRSYACYVYSLGNAGAHDYCNVDSDKYGVRPVLYVQP